MSETGEGQMENLNRKMYCLGCRYPLLGLDDHRCPECGMTFNPSDTTSYGTTGRTRKVWPAVLLAGLAGVPAGLFAALMWALGIGLGGACPEPLLLVCVFMSAGTIAASVGALLACAFGAGLLVHFMIDGISPFTLKNWK